MKGLYTDFELKSENVKVGMKVWNVLIYLAVILVFFETCRRVLLVFSVFNVKDFCEEAVKALACWLHYSWGEHL